MTKRFATFPTSQRSSCFVSDVFLAASTRERDAASVASDANCDASTLEKENRHSRAEKIMKF